MKHRQLGPTELELISAYLDGELDAHRADQVAARVEHDPAWAKAYRELRRVDELLDSVEAPPLRRDLTGEVLRKARAGKALPNWLRALTPLASAAAIVLVVWVYHAARPADLGPMSPPTYSRAEGILNPVPPADRFVVENLEMIQDMDVLKDFATLQAIDELESNWGGT